MFESGKEGWEGGGREMGGRREEGGRWKGGDVGWEDEEGRLGGEHPQEIYSHKNLV